MAVDGVGEAADRNGVSKLSVRYHAGEVVAFLSTGAHSTPVRAQQLEEDELQAMAACRERPGAATGHCW